MTKKRAPALTWGAIPTLMLLAACTGKPVPGDPSQFDPVGMFETIRSEAGEGLVLTRFEATGVRPDGRIDLTDKVVDGDVRYRFIRAVEPPANQPPLGAGGSAEPVWKEETRVHVRRRGWHHTGTRTDADGGTVQTYDRSRGLEVRTFDPRPGAPDDGLAPPACDLADLWRVAIERGAPQNAVATIDYYGGRYNFSISGTDVRVGFDADCTPR
jgi:hypothetical protein